MGRKSREKHQRRQESDLLAGDREMRLREGSARGLRDGCLLCRRRDVAFTGREHVIPESLGNIEKVLPAGVVCDRCNNQVCAPLDQALCSFMPIELMRTVLGIRSKSGRMPQVAFDNGMLRHDTPGEILLELAGRRWRSPDQRLADGRVQWSFTAKKRGAAPDHLALVHRCLVKMALEFAWMDLGPEAAMGAAWERERRLVLGGGERGHLIVPRICDVADRHDCSFTYQTVIRDRDQARITLIGADFWGVQLITDTLQAEPAGEVPEDVAMVLRF